MKKILIVEDEAPLLKALEEELGEGEEFKVLTAKDGKEGIDLALKERPHLILLDLLMPTMDGIAMLKQLRKDSWGKDVKVIILTNLQDREKVAEAVENRVYDYLVKSNWQLGDVRKRVQAELRDIQE